MFYHGSSKNGLIELIPFVSEHSKPYIYFTTNSVVASFYTVHRVGKPYSWYPYGFYNDIPVYNEYYPNALADIYKGKHGYIYECESLSDIHNPTNINNAIVCENPIKVTSCIIIEDVYNNMLENEKSGELLIKRFNEFEKQELKNVENMIVAEIEQHRLKRKANSDYGDFLKEKFPKAWERAV